MKMLCWIGRHRLRIIGRPSTDSHHYGCTRCKRQWGMNHNVRGVLDWFEVEGFYADVMGYRPSREQVAAALTVRRP